MHILIENSNNRFDNHGDNAMLVVAHDRLRKLWPDAVFEVITSQPDQLATYCPDAIPVDVRNPYSWSKVNTIVKEKAPAWLDQWKSVIETEVRLHWPFRSKDARLGAIVRADVVVHSGGGFINDEFTPNAMQHLDLIEKAITAGKPTAMFGQGIGPISQAPLVSKAAKVLPSVNFLALRESVGSYPILLSMGVDPSRIATTGDDAIALAHPRRGKDLGGELGVNIRFARYSGISSNDGKLLDRLRAALMKASEFHDAALILIPISKDDCQSFRILMKDDARFISSDYEEKHLDKVFEDVNRCRVVVTGSYHAAVFALAQGVSAICLARSGYYAQKFLGLADQFGEGCQVLFLDGPRIDERLEAMIDKSWGRAAGIRSQLLDAAKRQIDAGMAAYQGFFDLASDELQGAPDIKDVIS